MSVCYNDSLMQNSVTGIHEWLLKHLKVNVSRLRNTLSLVWHGLLSLSLSLSSKINRYHGVWLKCIYAPIFAYHFSWGCPDGVGNNRPVGSATQPIEVHQLQCFYYGIYSGWWGCQKSRCLHKNRTRWWVYGVYGKLNYTLQKLFFPFINKGCVV